MRSISLLRLQVEYPSNRNENYIREPNCYLSGQNAGGAQADEVFAEEEEKENHENSYSQGNSQSTAGFSTRNRHSNYNQNKRTKRRSVPSV